ncbi:MAG TPA: VOC family protein [Candidatus Binataceae bacterium]|nr:VOC family protein [Candidatus Binataceae bacterium]
MIKLKSFAHSAVRITDVEKSKQFYENVLGFERIPRPNIPVGGMWYGVGGNQIHLIQSRKRDGIDPTGPHMAFEVDDLEAAKAKLKELGIEYLDSLGFKMDGISEKELKMLGQQIWVLDPDGNTIELRANR